MNSVQTQPLGGGRPGLQSGLSIRILLAGVQPTEGKVIRSILREQVQCEIAGECDDLISTLKNLRQSPIDILFLDLDRPEFQEAELLGSWSADFARTTIILTDDSRSATYPAGMNVIDCLGKPVTDAAVRLSLAKAKGDIVLQKMHDLQQQIEKLSEMLRLCSNLAGTAGNQDRSNGRGLQYDKMMIKEHGRLKVVRYDEIEWIEAWRDYVRLHCREKTHVIHHTISDFESRLDSRQFLRIGRSVIVNVDRIRELEPMNHGDFLVVLQDNTQLNFSRHYRNRLTSMFGYRS